MCVSLRVKQKLRTNIFWLNQKDSLLYRELALSTRQKFVEFIVSKHNGIIFFFSLFPGLYQVSDLHQTEKHTPKVRWAEKKLLKHQISNHEVQWSLQEWLSMLEFWDFISSANLYSSQISYLISAGFYSLWIWCGKSKISFGHSVVRHRELICVRVHG